MNAAPDIAVRIVITLSILLLWLLVLGGGLALLYFLLSQPMRRSERARAILDLIDTALQRGDSVEQSLISISLSREQSLGVRFHVFVAWLEKGLSLCDAFRKVPSLLPRQMVAMLQAGVQVGDLRRVIPACRQLLADSISETRSALNYLVVITFVVSPVTLSIFLMIAVMVFPKLQEVGAGMGTGETTPITWLMHNRGYLVVSQLGLQLAMWTAAVLYILGPRARAVPGWDWFSWQLPWRRKRMQRDFSIMLASLLDANMPEADAIRLAATCTANRLFEQRAARVLAAVNRGQALPRAMEAVDVSGEFCWRLSNAAHSRGGFISALAGWHEALNAKAFQQQQAAAHIVSSAIVLFNGAFVAIIVIAVFSFLISIIDGGILW